MSGSPSLLTFRFKYSEPQDQSPQCFLRGAVSMATDKSAIASILTSIIYPISNVITGLKNDFAISIIGSHGSFRCCGFKLTCLLTMNTFPFFIVQDSVPDKKTFCVHYQKL